MAEVPRRPGMPARAGRAPAVRDAAGADPEPGEVYRVVRRSEREIGARL